VDRAVLPGQVEPALGPEAARGLHRVGGARRRRARLLLEGRGRRDAMLHEEGVGLPLPLAQRDDVGAELADELRQGRRRVVALAGLVDHLLQPARPLLLLPLHLGAGLGQLGAELRGALPLGLQRDAVDGAVGGPREQRRQPRPLRLQLRDLVPRRLRLVPGVRGLREDPGALLLGGGGARLGRCQGRRELRDAPLEEDDLLQGGAEELGGPGRGRAHGRPVCGGRRLAFPCVHSSSVALAGTRS
jgi:hypothetical protein